MITGIGRHDSNTELPEQLLDISRSSLSRYISYRPDLAVPPMMTKVPSLSPLSPEFKLLYPFGLISISFQFFTDVICILHLVYCISRSRAILKITPAPPDIVKVIRMDDLQVLYLSYPYDTCLRVKLLKAKQTKKSKKYYSLVP